jgi:hypothetical protein
MMQSLPFIEALPQLPTVSTMSLDQQGILV